MSDLIKSEEWERLVALVKENATLEAKEGWHNDPDSLREDVCRYLAHLYVDEMRDSYDHKDMICELMHGIRPFSYQPNAECYLSRCAENGEEFWQFVEEDLKESWF